MLVYLGRKILFLCRIMKIIYNTCYADLWIKVALKIKEEFGFEPLYWNGDNSVK